MIAGLAIVGTSILAACLYGIVHDLITAHLCVEYFTVGHPLVFPTESPVLLALGWGIIATWLVGALLGLPLATRVPAAQQVWFITDLWAHLAAYAVGFLGGVVLCVGTVLGRRRQRQRQKASVST